MKSLLPPELQKLWQVRDDVTREERLKELAFAGYKVPRAGQFQDLKRLGVPLVVYTDPYAHCGEGKYLWRPGEPEPLLYRFCTEFVARTVTESWSGRELKVGRYYFQLIYHSATGWRSNVDGTYEIRRWGVDSRNLDLLRYPMYAVDLVNGFAIDLNVCPGVPFECVNAVGREALTESVRSFIGETS